MSVRIDQDVVRVPPPAEHSASVVPSGADGGPTMQSGDPSLALQREALAAANAAEGRRKAVVERLSAFAKSEAFAKLIEVTSGGAAPPPLAIKRRLLARKQTVPVEWALKFVVGDWQLFLLPRGVCVTRCEEVSGGRLYSACAVTSVDLAKIDTRALEAELMSCIAAVARGDKVRLSTLPHFEPWERD